MAKLRAQAELAQGDDHPLLVPKPHEWATARERPSLGDRRSEKDRDRENWAALQADHARIDKLVTEEAERLGIDPNEVITPYHAQLLDSFDRADRAAAERRAAYRKRRSEHLRRRGLSRRRYAQLRDRVRLARGRNVFDANDLRAATAAIATRPRRHASRPAARPRARRAPSARSSVASGDSGDDGPDEPPGVVVLARRAAATAGTRQ